MILTPIAPDHLRRALGLFAASLEDRHAQRAFRNLAHPAVARRASGAAARAHHRVALDLARKFGMALIPGSPRAAFGWDGRALRVETEAYVLLHEVAHFQLASPARRRAIDFGLGAGPETGQRRVADRAAQLHGVTREREEALASLLGILWESALGQPALASFLDQNWLEGAGRPGAARHFTTIVTSLHGDGFLTSTGTPTRRLRQSPDAPEIIEAARAA